jgi:hypothetical protein
VNCADVRIEGRYPEGHAINGKPLLIANKGGYPIMQPAQSYGPPDSGNNQVINYRVEVI